LAAERETQHERAIFNTQPPTVSQVLQTTLTDRGLRLLHCFKLHHTATLAPSVLIYDFGFLDLARGGKELDKILI
jgi:hypothetical protein